MKQLIARIDDDLHRALKERAMREGRSLNELVAEVLAAAVDDRAAAFRRRLAASGLRVVPPDPQVPGPRREPGETEMPDAADAVMEALLAERDAR